METIVKFKAPDGTEFTNEQECVDYELLIDKVNGIMSLLPGIPKDDNCKFSNGEGYVQHYKPDVRKAQLQILEICKKHIDHKWIQETIDDENVHLSFVHRLVDDAGIRPIGQAWGRFMCIDSQSREWGQIYFAMHPSEGKQVQVGSYF